MTPASKGAQVRAKTGSGSSSAPARSGNKSHSTKVGATTTKRPTRAKKKAVPVVKKPATATKKMALAKKSATAAQKKPVVASKKATTAKKAAAAPRKHSPPTKKTPTAPTKKGPPTAAARKPEKAPAKKAATSGGAKTATGNGAAPATVSARSTFSPKAKPPTPVRPKTGPYAKDTKFLDEVRELLQAERAIYQEQAVSLRAEADSLALEREPGDVQFDEESGEGGTVTVDRERNLALSGQATLAVEEIDDALRRIADKSYGYCERCFQPIPKPRLRALPYARLCVACKSGGLSRR
jgi:RNA polymerase-binding transcription factor DksA